MKKRSQEKKRIHNRRAGFDYQLGDSYVVGIVLNGRETKALRLGHGQLTGSYVTIKHGELWLVNALVSGTQGITIDESEATRDRKLLAKKREIDSLATAKQQGKTIVATDILTDGRFIKVRIATGVGKREYDKRETIKRRDDNRRAAREMSRL